MGTISATSSSKPSLTRPGRELTSLLTKAGEPKRVGGVLEEGLEHLRDYSRAHPGRLDPLLLEDDVDVSLDFAKMILEQVDQRGEESSDSEGIGIRFGEVATQSQIISHSQTILESSDSHESPSGKSFSVHDFPQLHQDEHAADKSDVGGGIWDWAFDEGTFQVGQDRGQCDRGRTRKIKACTMSNVSILDSKTRHPHTHHDDHPKTRHTHTPQDTTTTRTPRRRPQRRRKKVLRATTRCGHSCEFMRAPRS